MMMALCAVAFIGCSTDEDNGGDENKSIPAETLKTFPDPVFREYVLRYFDEDKDGKISNEEALNVTSIGLSYAKITSIEGIQLFTNLMKFDCRGSTLTSLDMSNFTKLDYLNCIYCQLTTLNVSGCTALQQLWCYGNQLTTLDVSDCTNLYELQCQKNQLTNLDLSKNSSLEFLSCERNLLTTLDVSKTNLGYRSKSPSSAATTLICAPMDTLETLYLKSGWLIKGINYDAGYGYEYLPYQTKIVYVN